MDRADPRGHHEEKSEGRMPPIVKYVLFGFLAGAIAVPLGHQLVVLALNTFGVIPTRPYNMGAGNNPMGLPILINQILWGGIWGMGFALVWPALKKLPAWLAGLICGAVGNAILGNMILLPALGRGTFFGGWDPTRMAIGIAIGAGFGLAFGLIYGVARKRFA
jgi:hypothetical protein